VVSESSSQFFESNEVSAVDSKKIEFMVKCKEIVWHREIEDQFFGQTELAKNIGRSGKIRVRVGYNSYHQVCVFIVIIFVIIVQCKVHELYLT